MHKPTTSIDPIPISLALLITSLLACSGGDDDVIDDPDENRPVEGYRGQQQWCGGARWSATVQFDNSPGVPRVYRDLNGSSAATSTCWSLVHLPDRVALYERIERDGQLVGYCEAQGRPAPFRASITSGACTLVLPGGQLQIEITGGELDLANPDVATIDLAGLVRDHALGQSLRGSIDLRMVGTSNDDAPFPADPQRLTPPADCPARGCVVATVGSPMIAGEPACAQYAAERVPVGGQLRFSISPDGRTITQDSRELLATPAVTSCDTAAWEGASPADLWRYAFSDAGASIFHERTLSADQRLYTCQITWPATLEACP